MDAREEISSLAKTLRVYQDEYYRSGTALVSDAEYDRLSDRLKELEAQYPEYALEDSPTRRVGSDLTNDFPEVEHTIPVLSLDKAYSREEVLSFFSRTTQKTGGELSFVGEEKIDGISMVLYYEDGVLVRAVTRGNGQVGNDVTPNIITIPSVPRTLPEPLSIAVRGEVYLPKAKFNEVNNALPADQKAANPRNLAAGTVRRQKSQDAARVPLDMYCYEGFWEDREEAPLSHLEILSKLKALGFRMNPNLAFFDVTGEKAREKLEKAGIEGKAYAFSEMDAFISAMTEERPGLDHEIDGLVFKVNETDVRESLGYTEHHPRWAIAYKFESPQAQAVLEDITCQVGRTGRVTPVAEISPTLLNGSTIRRATLHNQEYINQLELAIGDTVSITKRGDVIPAVEEVVEKNSNGATTYAIPMKCPCCGAPLQEKGAHLYCPNYDCRDQAKGRIAFFASRDQMDIETLGPKTVDILYEAGIVRSVGEIYTADYDRALDLPGMGEKTVELLKAGVEKSREKPFRVVLASIGVPDLGKKSAEILIGGGFDSMDRIRIAAETGDLSAFSSIKGMGEETAKSLVEAFTDPHVVDTISALTYAGLHMSVEMDEAREEDLDMVFSGQVWCVTGSFENFNPRSKALQEIEKRGGRTVGSVTGKTTHLLAGKGGGGKRAEAIKLGVQIIDETTFLGMLGGKGIEKTGEPVQGMLF